MKTRFLFSIMVCCITLSIQAQKPFKELGLDHEVEVLTLSNGRYVEHFTNDTLRQIGSVMFNIITNKVAYIIPEDELEAIRIAQRDREVTRFMSVDPLAKDYPHNSPYAFSENRVVDAIELEGLELFLIHGTWGDNADLKPVLSNKIETLFGNTKTIDRGWSGDNLDKSRKDAAREYVATIKANREPGEPITIFSHSHGGNVGILVMNELVNDSEFEGVELNLVTLNTPAREYQLSEQASKRVHHYQVYNVKDPVQALGGNKVKFGKDGLLTIEFNLKIGNGVNFLTGEFGNAGRTFGSAINIEYDSHGILQQNHTGWNMENMNEWLPKLENTVNGGNAGENIEFKIPKQKSILGSEGM